MSNEKDYGTPTPFEGAPYKTVHAFGHTFSLTYGYYEERDRTHPPDVLYPDLAKYPVFTEAGEPLVTLMQDACAHFRPAAERHPDATCAECEHLLRGEDWFGLCRCKENRKKKNDL
ncbi:MAG: hypothetical protein IJV96_07965 [Clostridia bacterium]|nr:hypothetical protein [Clostridia bacterium]